jgi:P27 family predicted phage terminase small subunit
MGKRGPKPEPKALKVFKGTRFQRPDSVELLPASLPAPPAWLREHGRAVWLEVGPHIAAIGLVSSVDTGAFANYCDAWDDYFEAMKLIEVHGVLLPTDKGTMVMNPACRWKVSARQAIRQYQGEFGLTPAARVSLPSAPVGSDDLEDFKVG